MTDDEDYIALAEKVAAEMEAGMLPVAKTPAKPQKGQSVRAPMTAEISIDGDDPSEGGPGEKGGKKPVLLPGLVPDPYSVDNTLVDFLTDGEDPKVVYDQVVVEIAREAVHLKHLREVAQSMGIPFNQFSRDRVATLKDLAGIMATKAKELSAKGGNSGGPIDFGSVEFRRVMSHLITQMMDAAKAAAIPDHSIKLLASGLQQRLNGFEDKAKDLYYGNSGSSKKKEALNAGREI